MQINKPSLCHLHHTRTYSWISQFQNLSIIVAKCWSLILFVYFNKLQYLLFSCINLPGASKCGLFWCLDKMLKQSLLDTPEHQADISCSNLQSLPHCSLIRRLNVALCWFKLLFKMPGKFAGGCLLSDLLPVGWPEGFPCSKWLLSWRLTASLQGMCLFCSLLFLGTDPVIH